MTTQTFETGAAQSRETTAEPTGRFASQVAALIAVALLLASALLFGGTAKAEESGSQHPMRFDRISLEDGLSQSNVFTILQDSDGLMWFGTENGLNRYNGYDFTVFKRERGNPDALANDYIFDIAEDRDGRLWVASNGGGLARMDRQTGRVVTFRQDEFDANSISSDSIRTLLVDTDGTIWLGTRDAGVDRFDPATGTAENFNFGEADDPNRNVNEIYAMHRDAEGFLWVGTNNGLVKLNPKTGNFVHFEHADYDNASLSGHRVGLAAQTLFAVHPFGELHGRDQALA